MGAALLMGKRKKEAEVSPETAGATKQKPAVKLSPAFHQQLKFVADDAGIDMGDLVEREMGAFVSREFDAITERLRQSREGKPAERRESR